jgi:hypothetical protein
MCGASAATPGLIQTLGVLFDALSVLEPRAYVIPVTACSSSEQGGDMTGSIARQWGGEIIKKSWIQGKLHMTWHVGYY